MPIDFCAIWKQLPQAWEAAQPFFWRETYEAVSAAMDGVEPKIIAALTEDVVDDFRVHLCGARTFKGLSQSINANTWQEFLRTKARETVDLNREAIATGDYWRLRPLKRKDPQAWAALRSTTDEVVRSVCLKKFSNHPQAATWLPIWLSDSDEFIETITAEFRRNGIQRCFSWNDLDPYLGKLAAYRIGDLLTRRTKRTLLHTSVMTDEDWDMFWPNKHPSYVSPMPSRAPDAESNFVRQDLLELFKAAGVPGELAAIVIENKCDGTPMKELVQNLAEPPSLATLYTRVQDIMDLVKAYASSPENQRRWRGTSLSEEPGAADPVGESFVTEPTH